MKYFDNCHPVVVFTYLLGTIGITMFTANPIIIAISYISSMSFLCALIGWRETIKSFVLSLPMIIIISLTNPIFVHKGETILFFLNDNPVTLEAILYGIYIAFMLISVYNWFRCYNIIMTSDKFIFLFGRIIPKISLIISMVLSFVPKFKKQFIITDEAQRAMGIYASKSYVDKLSSKFRVLSILITWSIENAIETGDSMQARGYGLKGRTSFAIFSWTKEDIMLMITYVLMIVAIVAFIALNVGNFIFYPTFSVFEITAEVAMLYAMTFILMMSSSILEMRERIIWLYLRSKI